MTLLLTTFILLDTAHRLSPLLLSWFHPGFRRLMLREPRRYILPPFAAFLIGAAISVATGLGLTSYHPGPGMLRHFTSWSNPLPIMLGVYFLWNFWHFAMQNYGVLRLCGCSSKFRWRALAFIATAIGFKVSYPVVFVHHWLTDIGLSAKAMGRQCPVFLTILLIVSPVAFLWDMPPWLTSHQTVVYWQANNLGIVMVIGLATSVSFAHFAASRVLWKLRDPQVRATIGKELFA